MNKNPQSKTSEFIQKAIKKHGDKYDYSKVEYTGNVSYKMVHINNFTNFLHHIMLSKQHNMLPS